MNPEPLGRGCGRAEAAAACGVVVVVHGGRSVSTEPTSAGQLSVLRMIPIGRAIGHAVHGSSVVVRRPRFRLRGWNGAQAVRGGDHAMLRRALLASPPRSPVQRSRCRPATNRWPMPSLRLAPRAAALCCDRVTTEAAVVPFRCWLITPIMKTLLSSKNDLFDLYRIAAAHCYGVAGCGRQATVHCVLAHMRAALRLPARCAAGLAGGGAAGGPRLSPPPPGREIRRGSPQSLRSPRPTADH